jgi:hypothetical protein
MKSRNLFTGAFASALLALLGGTPAFSSAVYTYRGNVFDTVIDHTPPAGTYTTRMSLTGSFDLASPLLPNLSLVDIAPMSFSFNDGRNTITNLNADLSQFKVSTDATGNINAWAITLTTGDLSTLQTAGQQISEILTEHSGLDEGEIVECTVAGSCSVDLLVDVGRNLNPGTWASSETPLPAALPLFATGLGALGVIGWRRKKKAAALAS